MSYTVFGPREIYYEGLEIVVRDARKLELYKDWQIRVYHDGHIPPDKVKLLQAADKIFIDILKEKNLYDKIWQAFCVLIPIKTVGVMGDERTYENTIAIRAVNSVDGMTANWARIPFDTLDLISSEIINNVKGVNKVVFDISNKPPSTIEWE